MRMTASWCDPHMDRPNTRLWRDFCAPMASSPRISRADLQACKTTHVGERRAPHNSNPQCLEQRRMTFVRCGDNYDGSDCAFAVKPRAFGAPQAALGLDRSAQPSKGLSMPQMQSGDVTK